MQDESLIDEMRETLRADRERAVDRRRERVAAQTAGTGVEEDVAPEPRPPGLFARLARRSRRG